MTASNDQILSAFGQGQAASWRDGYRADNPHMPETQRELWEAWNAGFEWEEGPKYILK